MAGNSQWQLEERRQHICHDLYLVFALISATTDFDYIQSSSVYEVSPLENKDLENYLTTRIDRDYHIESSRPGAYEETKKRSNFNPTSASQLPTAQHPNVRFTVES